jgi:hypothetical protein
MKYTTIQWHLARDNQTKLAKFCEKNKVRTSTELYTANDGEHDYFQITYTFNNGGFITAELLHGESNKGFSVADHFQVVDYALGM